MPPRQLLLATFIGQKQKKKITNYEPIRIRTDPNRKVVYLRGTSLFQTVQIPLLKLGPELPNDRVSIELLTSA